MIRKEARKWLPLIRKLLDGHKGKTAIRAALVWSERLLNLPGDTAVHAELRRLRDKGVTPQDFLETIGAVFVFAFSHYDPRELPDDERLHHNLANTLLRLRPPEVRYCPSGRGYKYERNTSTTRVVLGDAIAVGPIFMQLLALHDREQEQERQLKADLKAPIIDTSI